MSMLNPHVCHSTQWSQHCRSVSDAPKSGFSRKWVKGGLYHWDNVGHSARDAK
jgi:hypothetical protein